MKKKKLKKKIRSMERTLRINETNNQLLWEMMKKLIIKSGESIVDFLPDDEVLRTMYLL